MPILSIINSISVAVILLDGNGEIRHLNGRASALLGYSAKELSTHSLGILLADHWQHRRQRLFAPGASDDFEPQAGSDFETSVRRKDGSIFPAEVYLVSLLDDGQHLGLACLHDLTVYKRRQNALDRSNRALSFLSGSFRSLRHANDIASLSENVCRLAVHIGGYHQAEIDLPQRYDQPPFKFATHGDGEGHSPDPAPRSCQTAIALPLRIDRRILGSLTLYAETIDAFDEEETALLTEVAEELAFGIETLHTRQARQWAEGMLEDLAHRDYVTGLPNRTKLTQFLAAEFSNFRTGALLFVDLDRFKEINDTLGYAVGDAVLRALAERLAADLGPGELLGRIGGDEFILLAPGADGPTAAGIAERLARSLRQPLVVADLTVYIGARIGIALYPDGRSKPEEAFADAGLASRVAETTFGGFRFYLSQMSDSLNERRSIAQRLKVAASESRLHLHYQPKVDMTTHALVGAEALLRWQEPDWGYISPAKFIPVAEERGLMPELGKWTLAEACRQLSAWRAVGLEMPAKLAINVSSMQFKETDFMSSVARLVTGAGCQPSDFELEITESVLAAEGHAAIATTKALAEMGFEFAIDDFGTGFSSLAYLSRFPAGTLKIDISFVRNMLKSARDHAIVQTIIAMAKSLGLASVAEGVERQEEAQALTDLGCTVAQGYLFGAPVPAAIFAKCWLNPINSESQEKDTAEPRLSPWAEDPATRGPIRYSH